MSVLGLSRDDRQARLSGLRHEAAQVAERTGRIYRTVLDQSEHIRAGNFSAIGVADLGILFRLYDAEFFAGLLARMLREDEAGELGLRLSSRMTRAAGKTFCRRFREPSPSGGIVERPEYEIAVSSVLLFTTFRDPERLASVGGLVCRDRLEALQRVFEHELLHLAEFLAWGFSNCSAENFHRLSRQIFGHSGAHHDLMTPRELAAKVYAVRVGDRVSFEHEGVRHVGHVNRITKRASVLVPDPAGPPFSDGGRYRTFYVPLSRLRKEAGSGPQ